jgi:type I restriction enzyme R subunit
MSAMVESVVEEAALAWLSGLGYASRFGPEIAPGEPGAERDDYRQVLLLGRLRAALQRLSPRIPTHALAEALRQVTHLQSPSVIANNRAFHRRLADGAGAGSRGGVRDRVRRSRVDRRMCARAAAASYYAGHEGQPGRAAGMGGQGGVT